MLKYSCIVIVLSISLVGCVNREAQKLAKQTQAIATDKHIAVTVAQPELQDIPSTLSLTGSLKADNDLSVSAKVPGRLVSVYVKEGEMVQAGQVVAQQDTSDAHARLAQAQSSVAAARAALKQAELDAQVSPTRSDAAVRASEARVRQAKASLNKLLNGSRSEEKAQAKAALDRAKAELEAAKSAYDRSQRLFDQGAISKAQLEADENRYEQAEAAVDQAQAAYDLVLDVARPEDIAQARAALSQAEEQLRADKASKRLDASLVQRVISAKANLVSALQGVDLARSALQDLTIRAGVSGKVSGTPAAVGTMLSPGTPIMRLVGTSDLFYEADVPEKDIVKLRSGMEVDVAVTALDVVLTGAVAAIDPIPSEMGRLYRVRVSLLEDLAALKPGMFARSEVVLGRDTDVITIPSAAILDEQGKSFVFIVKGSGDDAKVEKLEIKVIRDLGEKSIVEGVTESDSVVVKGKTSLIDGSLIKIEDPAAKGNED